MEKKTVKVKFVYYNLENNLEVESLWADKEGQYYRIKNIPFFASNVAYDDLISVEDDNGELFHDDMVEESGNTTLQIIIFDESNIEHITNELSKFKCGWEGSHLKGYIAVNVPKDVIYTPIKDFLDIKTENKILDYKESCLEHEF